jgi:ribose transport system ATP-binding protein
MSVNEPLLTIRGLSKTFTGQRALIDVDLDVRGGEVHGLCGQNGSGKSTVIKILSGYHEPDIGATLRFMGYDLSLRHEASLARHRMKFIHQDLGLVNSLNTAENLALSQSIAGRILAPVRQKASYQSAFAQLAELGMSFDVRAPVGTLKPVERTMVAIVRAIQGWEDGGGLLVLDEPTVSLPIVEVNVLFEVVRRLRDRGAAVLYVSHRLEEFFELSDRLSVLRDGRRVLTRTTSELSRADVADAIVGRKLPNPHTRSRQKHQDVVLSVRGLRADEIADVSFDVTAGEILGVTGLVGSGVDRLPDVLFGAFPLAGGSVAINGNPIRLLTPSTATAAGMAYVPADRGTRGAIMNHSIRENMTLAELRSLTGRLKYISRRREVDDATSWARRVELQGLDLERLMTSLSGGNQQKVVIARALRTLPKVLILHEPVQGVDIGAKAAIYSLIEGAANLGMAVLTVSTDTEDLARLADRVLILNGGRCTGELTGSDLSPKVLTRRILLGSSVLALVHNDESEVLGRLH